MNWKRASTAVLMFSALTLSAVSAPTLAQDYPSRAVTLISGFAAGGPADEIARSIGRALEAELKQPVTVETRAGATGTIALQALADSRPDGYTIGLVANTTTTALHFAGKPFDIDNMITPIGRFVSTRILLVVNPEKVAARTLPELIDYMRRNPGSTWTSAGHGGLGHLGLELFALDQKLRITHVPYNGSAPAMMDVIAGRVNGMVIDATTAMPHIQSGRLRPIVVASTIRAPALPNLPTALELGYASMQIDSSLGIVAPARTPRPIADRLGAALKRAVDSDQYVKAAEAAGNARFFEDGPTFRDWLKRDFDRWGGVIRDANIKPE